MVGRIERHVVRHELFNRVEAFDGSVNGLWLILTQRPPRKIAVRIPGALGLRTADVPAIKAGQPALNTQRSLRRACQFY